MTLPKSQPARGQLKLRHSQSPAEAAHWIDRYTRLIRLLQTHLDETQRIRESVPEALRHCLSAEDVAILTEQITEFERALAYWHEAARAGSPSTAVSI